jgi:hypothetical protein
LLGFSQFSEAFMKNRNILVATFLLLLIVYPTNAGLARVGQLPEFTGVRAESADKRVVLEVDADGHFQLTHQGEDAASQESALPYIPSRFLIPNSGQRVVLLGERGQERPTKAVTLLDRRGEVLKELRVDEMFSAEAHEEWQRCLHCPWLTDAWIDNKLDVLVVISQSAFALQMGLPQELPRSEQAPTVDDLVAVRSLQDGSPVLPWDALTRAAQPRSLARKLLLSPGFRSYPASKLRELFSGSEPSSRQLAVELALSHAGPESDKILVATLADCDLPGQLRVRAASTMAARGDDRGIPVVLLAAAVPRRSALKGRSRKDLCLHSLNNYSSLLEGVSGIPDVLPTSEWTPVLAKHFRKGSPIEDFQSHFLQTVARQLARGGREGQISLAELLMQFRDDRSLEVRALVRALQSSHGDSIPEALKQRLDLEFSTQEVAEWRAWAASLVE